MDTEFFQSFIDFLQFQRFVAEDVLKVFYALCAILIPIAAWYFLFWFVRRYAVLVKFYQDTKYSIFYSFIIWLIRKIKFFSKKIEEKITWQTLNTEQKLKLVALYVAMVFMAELFLRLVFEYLIAFMQMHEWLRPPLV